MLRWRCSPLLTYVVQKRSFLNANLVWRYMIDISSIENDVTLRSLDLLSE